MQLHFTDRSRIVLSEKCKRARLLNYHLGGTGIVPKRESIYTVVGGAVHEGLAHMLTTAQRWLWDNSTLPVEHLFLGWNGAEIMRIEESSVAIALLEFDRSTQDGMDLAGDEANALTPQALERYQERLAASLGVSPQDASLGTVQQRAERIRSQFDQYLLAEQRALVEALVRAYARRRLRPLLEQFEVLEVEREGQWRLSEWSTCQNCGREFSQQCVCDDEYSSVQDRWELWFMSRPDALLRERQSNALYLLSYKTTGSWDQRKEKDIQRDMQGLSEGVEVERRLAEWWQTLHPTAYSSDQLVDAANTSEMYKAPPMVKFLRSCTTSPRILGVRYEFLLKGERRKDDELSSQLGVEARSQRSHLIRQYVAVSQPKKGEAMFRLGDTCWSYEYVKDTGEASKLYYGHWKNRPVFSVTINGQSGQSNYPHQVKAWIDLLDASQEAMSGYDPTVGLPPRSLGWKSDAQALGYTAQHPLDAAFVPPIHVMRNDDDLRDWVEQTEHQERVQVEHLVQLQAAGEEGERRSLMNRFWPKSRGTCAYFFGGDCPYLQVCFPVNAEVASDPVGSGLYKARVPNHPQEVEDGKR